MKIAKELTALEVKRLTTAGLHAVGTVPGLRLNVSASGARSWVLRVSFGGKRKDIGLGSYPAVPLADAWKRARETLDQIRAGVDPAAQRRTKAKEASWTFRRCAEVYMDGHRAGWKNAKHAEQWTSTLETYVYPHFGDKHVATIGKADVLAAVEPHWTTKNETMVRVRNRIELILSWAMQREHRPAGLNPAAWRGNLDQALPRPSKVNRRKPHEAVPIDQVYAFMQRLSEVQGMSARCLEFVCLTACRSGEARGATWAEMDLTTNVWSIPGERMKAGRPHRVPLPEPAVSLLKALPRFVGTDLVFPGRDVEKPLSDMSLTQTMRRLGLTAVPHGLRSSFRDWAAERTAHPAEVAEMALAHAIGSSTEQAYRRGDLFDKRTMLMADWAQFVNTKAPDAKRSAVQGAA